MALVTEFAALQGIFGIVLFVVVAVAIVVAAVSLLTRNRAYDQIGRGGLSLNEDRLAGAGAVAEPTGPLAPAALERERDDEIRQMLEARNERRARRGQAPLDVEAELARLTASAPASTDPQLAEEVRQLVIASNERRARQGLAPLDVEQEVARRLRELSD